MLHYHHNAGLLAGVEHIRRKIQRQIICKCLLDILWRECVLRLSLFSRLPPLSSIFFALYGWSTNPFKFKWPRGYVCNLSYSHNQIGSINISCCCHIYCVSMPELAVPSYSVSFIYISGKLGIVSTTTHNRLMCANNRPCILHYLIIQAYMKALYICLSSLFCLVCA